MFDFQAQIIFPTHAVPEPGPLPASAERWTLETPDGETLVGIHFPADHPQSKRTLILAFGGNAWNAQDVAEYLHDVYPDEDVVAFHFRGYSPSTGSPSADALIADSSLVYDFAVGKLGPARIVAVGFSIGSGIAARVAETRKLDGAILVTPFDSLKAVAQSMYPWLPIGHFFAHEIAAGEALATTNTPIALIAAERDDLIVPARTEALRNRVRNLVLDRTIKGAGHNDIYSRSDFHSAMRDALDCLKL